MAVITANVGIAPPDFNTPVGQVRLLLGDTDPTDVGVNDDNARGVYQWYSDAELLGLLTLYAQNVKRVAVRCLRMIAGSQSMLLKKWTSADLAVDGPAITTALLQAANEIEASDNFDEMANITAGLIPTGGVSWEAFQAKHSDGFIFNPLRTGRGAGYYGEFVELGPYEGVDSDGLYGLG